MLTILVDPTTESIRVCYFADGDFASMRRALSATDLRIVANLQNGDTLFEAVEPNCSLSAHLLLDDDVVVTSGLCLLIGSDRCGDAVSVKTRLLSVRQNTRFNHPTPRYLLHSRTA